jgi:hypothetical protein
MFVLLLYVEGIIETGKKIPLPHYCELQGNGKINYQDAKID